MWWFQNILLIFTGIPVEMIQFDLRIIFQTAGKKNPPTRKNFLNF